MKILFFTTNLIAIQHEHYFTKNVWKYLIHTQETSENNNDLVLASVLEDAVDNCYTDCIQWDARPYYRLHLTKELNRSSKIDLIADLLALIAPTVIHSNMIEGYDVEAAYRLHIPICLTIHIGGFICPRGGGNGFLKHDNTICNQAISLQCTHCSCCDLPFPKLSYLLFQLCPKFLSDYISSRLHQNLFYITPFLSVRRSVSERSNCIQLFKNATIIAANRRLVHLLTLNGLKNIRLIPHGVEERQRLAFPPTNGAIKLYFLGRIQQSKGLHILLDALKGISTSKYELHVIGDAEPPRKEQRYYRKIKRLAKNKNVIFHGRLPNSEIDRLIKDFHLMVFPTICLEVYGICVSESLSMGRPVLATKCGGSEMQITDNVNGWLIKPNCTQELHDKLNYLLNNPALIEKAAQHTKLPHSVIDYTAELWQLYKELSDNSNESYNFHHSTSL